MKAGHIYFPRHRGQHLFPRRVRRWDQGKRLSERQALVLLGKPRKAADR